jgi:hypothetical protein
VETIYIYPIVLRTDYPIVKVIENEHGRFTTFISYGAEIIYPHFKGKNKMNSERDRYLTEQMGKCWHEWDKHEICVKCYLPMNIRDLSYRENEDFSTWPSFGILWEWATKEEWWYDFYLRELNNAYRKNPKFMFDFLINPDHFSNSVYEFLKDRNV